MEHTTLGGRIKTARKKLGITALALASQVGVTENAIRKIESGSSAEPRFSTGVRIAQALRTDPADLLPAFVRTAANAPRLDDIVGAINRCRPELERRGVSHVSIFGSVARGESSAKSDVDVVIDVARGRRFSLFDQIEIGELLQDVLLARVDVLTRKTLRRTSFARAALAQAVRVF